MGLLIAVVVVALIFDYTNGFHDTANAIATSVSTRALSPKVAVLGAAFFNFAGAFISIHFLHGAVASAVGKGIVNQAYVDQPFILAALLGAISWNLITWRFGLPSSSSHALIGGLVGAMIAKVVVTPDLTAGPGVQWSGLVDKVIIPMVASPFFGFIAAYFLMTGLFWLVRNRSPQPTNRLFRRIQPLAAMYMAWAHGANDAQKTMGVIAMALVAYNTIPGQAPPAFYVPTWVVLICAMAMALGTYSGGWRIIHTLGSKVIKLDPIHGFVAETTAATVITLGTRLGMPLSTTHVITSTIMGTGATQRLSAVKWGVAGNIMTAWVLTIPAAGSLAAAAFLALRPFLY